MQPDRNRRAFIRVAATLLAAGLLAARPDTAHASAPDTTRYTRADVEFMQGMIAHHGQAIEMAALIPSRTKAAPLLALGQRIDISQRDEIVLMQTWLRDRKEEVPAAGHAGHAGMDHPMLMPGMLTPEQMTHLASATGTEFERMFLTGMIQHHEGALAMVATLFSTPGAGQESDAFRFASDVDTDQRAEIRRMRALLDQLGGPLRP